MSAKGGTRTFDRLLSAAHRDQIGEPKISDLERDAEEVNIVGRVIWAARRI